VCAFVCVHVHGREGGGGRTGGEKEGIDMSSYFVLTPQEVLTGAKLLKRMTFAIFSGEKDQYVSYLPDIQRKPSFVSSASSYVLAVRGGEDWHMVAKLSSL